MNDFVKATEMENYRDILDELLGLEEGLTSWEVDFIEKLDNWDGSFTNKQADTLEKIYDRRC